MRVPIWLSVVMFTAFVGISLSFMASPVTYDRTNTATTVDQLSSVPEVAHPTDLTVGQVTDLPCWRDVTATVGTSDTKCAQQIVGIAFREDPIMTATAAPQLALSWWRHDAYGQVMHAEGHEKIS